MTGVLSEFPVAIRTMVVRAMVIRTIRGLNKFVRVHHGYSNYFFIRLTVFRALSIVLGIDAPRVGIGGAARRRR